MYSPSAFPVNTSNVENYGAYQAECGMTLLDWFAGQVANGMAAHSGTSGISYGPGDIAQRSYEIADAMLVEREKRNG